MTRQTEPDDALELGPYTFSSRLIVGTDSRSRGSARSLPGPREGPALAPQLGSFHAHGGISSAAGWDRSGNPARRADFLPA